VKILHVIGSVDPKLGGTTDHVFSTSRLWCQHGHECHVLCLDSPNAPCVEQSPLVTFALGSQGRWSVFMRKVIPWLRYGYTDNLAGWLREHARDYDAIILNGLWNYTSFGSWLALRDLDVPYFVCPHGMLDPWLRKADPTKHVLRMTFWYLVEWRVIRDARAILFACEEEMKLGNRFFLGHGCPGYVVGYGAQDVVGDPNEQRAAFLARYPEVRGRKVILFLSRIHPKKGLDLLIQAFARQAGNFSDFDLLIAGPDQVGLKPRLMKMAADLGISNRIHWADMLTGDEKWGAFRSAQFLILPSHQENFGIVVVEAMALSVPVLITRKVNIWREVQSSGAGYVVADDVEGIAEGLRYMCQHSPAKLEVMGEKARHCFIDRFNLENNSVELLNLIIRLTKSQSTEAVAGEYSR
jgi:glycosyltransferase involved in cell wall biosynthesis